VLIVGYGSIGAAIERRLIPFDVSVLRVARRGRDGVAPVERLPELLPKADIVVVIVPLTTATTGLVDAEFLSAMADGALLVNAARGPVVDTDALLAELRKERLRAVLDVTDPEPLPEGHPLWSAPGLLLTPHVGGSVPGGMRRAFRIVAEQLAAFVQGKEPPNLVVDGY
jgi:phosphoglycerate dehydrogenase-like enzyme